MKKYIKHIIRSVAVITLLGFITASPLQAAVVGSPATDACSGIKAAGGTCDPATGDSGFEGIVTAIIHTLSIIVGAVSVIMIIIGGFRYVISGGDSNGVTGAKNTIMYAIIGLIVVLFAQVIVRFVYSTATKPAAPAATKEAGSDKDPIVIDPDSIPAAE